MTAARSVLIVFAVGLAFAAVWLTTPGPARLLRGEQAAVHARVTQLEERLPAGTPAAPATWHVHLKLADQSLGQNDVSRALRAWSDAYGAALAVRNWEAMVDVGESALRIGQAARSAAGARSDAHHAYLSALVRARRDRSVEGMVRVAEAFAALGDRPVASYSLEVAARMAAESGDDRALEHVRAAEARLHAVARARGR